MLFIEFPLTLEYGEKNIIKYRNVEEEDWYYVYMDVETLNLLVQNFGIISTIQFPATSVVYRNCDNPSTGKIIERISYCGADIKMYCGNNTKFYLPFIEQNY